MEKPIVSEFVPIMDQVVVFIVISLMLLLQIKIHPIVLQVVLQLIQSVYLDQQQDLGK